MSTTELFNELEMFISRKDRIPDEFWIKAENDKDVIWLLDREDGTAGSYETSQERFGVTKDGDIIWGFTSGCSCWSGWDSGELETSTYKEFVLKHIKEYKGEEESRYDKPDDCDLAFSDGWSEESMSNMADFRVLIQDQVTGAEVLKIRNAEIRRYLMKRVGYEEIKDSVKAEVIHKDGSSELLKINDEMYVKVVDSSTDREYLLYVPGHIKTCRQGVAWTFGLQEDEYNPLKET